MKYSVDRIENTVAVCEDENGEIKNIKINILPPSVYEGSIIEEKPNGSFVVSYEETEKMKEEIFNLQQSIFGRKKE